MGKDRMTGNIKVQNIWRLMEIQEFQMCIREINARTVVGEKKVKGKRENKIALNCAVPNKKNERLY